MAPISIVLPKLPPAKDHPCRGISSRDLRRLLRGELMYWETWHMQEPRDEYRPGYCYLMRFGGEFVASRALCKIGLSHNPVERLAAVEQELGRPGRLVHIIPCRDANAVERELHTAFDAQRVKMSRRWREFYWLTVRELALVCMLGPQ